MKKLFLKSFALVAMLLCGLTASASAVDWSTITWAGDGAQGGALDNKYKVYTPKDVSLVNIQKAGTTTEAGFYITFPDVAFGEFRIDGVKANYALQDASGWLYVSNFTAKETEVQVMNADNSAVRWTLYVYYEDGIETGGEEKETIKPTMTSAELVKESVTYNSVVINVAGTDKETEDGKTIAVSKFNVVYGETSKTYTATDGKITITDLTPGTAYSFTIYAVDAAGNVSEAGLTVEATTANRDSQCSGECGHFGNPTVKRIAYTIEYNPVKKTVVYTISALNGKKLDFMEVQTTKGNFGVKIPEGGSTSCTYSQTNVNEGDEIGIRFLYSTDEIGTANEMNAQNVTLSDPNIIYYKVGDCEMEEDNVAPVMESATLESNTYNSAVIAVEATDNKGVVSYNVVDEVNSFNANFVAVDGKITVTGLTQNTTYNLAISAVDLAGNVSAEAKTVVVTTDKHLYAPEDVPAAPVHEASKVLSIYSDTYTSNGYTHGEWEGGAAMTEKEIDGNHYNLYTFGETGWGNYFGLALGKEIDVTNMKKLHLDIWSEVDIQELKVTPIWKVATGGGKGTEISQTVALEGQKWNSIDVTLADLVGVTTWQFVYQIKLFGMARYVLALDNIYFWTDGISTQLEEQEVAPKVTKTIENGQLVIIRDGVRYNVMGNVIR